MSGHYLFSRRHFQWFADFAKEHLNRTQRGILAVELEKTGNPGFKRQQFLDEANPAPKNEERPYDETLVDKLTRRW